MLSIDLVNALSNGITKKVDNFTTNLSITSLTAVGTTVTGITAAVHNLLTGQGITIVGAETTIAIDTFTRAGTVGTIVTLTNHDATKGAPVNVDTEGADESEFNGSFLITRVLNRRTIEVAMIDAGPTVATGTPITTNIFNPLQSYNGVFLITDIPSTTTFEYEVRIAPPLSPALGSPELRSEARIVGAVDMQRIIDMYTKQPPTDFWLFVTIDDVIASKSRNITSDAVDNIQRSNYFRQQILQDCTIYLIVPASAETSGADARDIAETMFLAICQSVLFARFDSQLSNGKLNPLQFQGHGTALYNAAYYVHSYNFQQVADLEFEDTIGYDEDVAFRDISLTQSNSLGTGEIETLINLDEVPL